MNIDEILHTPFSFIKRSEFIPCDTRPLWKSCLLILILGITGRNSKCSLKKIHTANWLTKKNDHYDEIFAWSKGQIKVSPNVRLEPSIDRAIDLLTALNYVNKKDGKVELTASGENFFAQIENTDVFSEEKNTLRKASKLLSEAAIDRLFKAG
ncbi:hypothetical protein [Pseudomonas nunensis]|uniref:hypothetical protein n=1 Tax=Pseudomonas nunensis TaxID=2961896 RepID=UPI0025B0D7D6|nr:hypothetical protein [Pseudomonas nunensis]MDN3221899.1 hypothetical protein [Pseudomonas nunensis]